MKLTVTKGFIDKDTNIFHNVGEKVEYPEARAKEIEYKGFGRCEEPKPSKAKPKEETKVEIPEVEEPEVKVETKKVSAEKEETKFEQPKKVSKKK